MNCPIIKKLRTVACAEKWLSQTLSERVRRLKGNMYMTKEVWEKKTIFFPETGKWYSYADVDAIINN